LVGVAVKVTVVPVHTGFALATMETLAVTVAVTVMVTVLDVAGLPVTHPRLEVITTYTWSPWSGV
jgi:hypothetical protein